AHNPPCQRPGRPPAWRRAHPPAGRNGLRPARLRRHLPAPGRPGRDVHPGLGGHPARRLPGAARGGADRPRARPRGARSGRTRARPHPGLTRPVPRRYGAGRPASPLHRGPPGSPPPTSAPDRKPTVIVVAGEALIDLVPREPGDPLSPLTPARGGGPYNTAVALARLGSPVAFCSRVSTDAFGASLVERLEAEGVDTGPVQRGPEPTSLAAVLPGPDGSADYAFYTEGTADRLFTLPGPLPAGTRALSLGTCSLVLEPGASAYRELLRREAGRGVFIALDPNVRPQLIADPG